MDLLRSTRGLALAVALACGLAATASVPAWAAPSEEEVKAAYLFNFARYVTWPTASFESTTDPIRICILNDEAFHVIMQRTVSGKQVNDRPVVAELRGRVSQAGDCHILFLESTQAGDVSGLEGASVFIVSDREGFATSGGTANFVRSGSKVRFEINPGAVEKAGLQVSSRLLRLAQIVE